MTAPEDQNGLREALARAEAERDEKARQYLHWMGVAARAMAENSKLRAERQIVDGRIRAQRASLRQAWGIIDKGQFSRAMQAHRRLLKNWIERTHAAKAERDHEKSLGCTWRKAAEDWARERDETLARSLALLDRARAAETELDEERQESARLALAVTEGQAEIARLRDGMERIASFPENYDKDGQSWGVGYAFYAVRKIARATLSPKEQP